jgi:hypothetical protein
MTRTLSLLMLAAGLLFTTACGDKDPELPEDTGTPVIDEDGDGYDADSDCDDGDPAVHPGAAEVCDEVDNDCDGEVDEDVASPWYPDVDGDGYGDDDNVIDSCDEPSGYVDVGGDCDDDDPDSYPGADELCDEADNDCDGEIDEDPLEVWYVDTDGDGYGNLDYPVHECDPGEGWVQDATDCDDTDADVHPEAAERCNELDDDCDGEVDEDLAATWYADADGDGYGDSATTTDDCDPGSGWVADGMDCDDTDAEIHPAAGEHCDGFDNDCDGLVDDADPDVDDQQVWYVDGDGDGYGVSSTVETCTMPSGYAAQDGDCNDGDVSINPAGTETCNGLDDDCDGLVDDDDTAVTGTSTWYLDYDGDGYGGSSVTADACDQPRGYTAAATDCDDLDAGSYPGATELCDGADNDCDGTVDESDAADAPTWWADTDGDGYGDSGSAVQACDQPSGHVADDRPGPEDCDDRDAAVNPGASEVCNGVDDDCDGLVDDDDPGVSGKSTWYADVDGDGYGDATAALVACFQPSGYVADDSDCSDRDPGSNPGATELCDGADNDCDGTVDEGSAADAATWYADDDADGFGDPSSTTTACSQPSGYVGDGSDCDDRDDDINPGADELCNGFDDDCDGTVDESSALDAGQWYADGDGDGYGDAASGRIDCTQPSGTVADDTDCDDGDAAVNPGASELCNSVDDDCDGTVDESDAIDASTWYADVDGDGYGDAASSDRDCDAISGYVADATDCDDTDAAVYPGADEYCDGIDSDCDGVADEGDALDADTWYADGDGDGYGDAGSATDACSQPSGTVSDAADCDDGDAAIHPGVDEYCDGVDNDCDGTVDEDDALDTSTWYLDADGDGYGVETDTVDACDAPSGYAAVAGDCDDDDASVTECSFREFDGTYASSWETLATPTEHLYSVQSYHPSDMDYIYNMYDNTGQRYDPATDSWTTLSASAPYSAPWTSMAPVDGDLWMIRNSAVYLYEPDIDTWTTVTSISGGDDLNMTESDEFGVVYGHTSAGQMVSYDTGTGSIDYFTTGLGSEYETRMGYDPGERAIFFGAYNAPYLYRWGIDDGSISTMTSIPESQLNDIFCSDRSGHIYAAGSSSGTTMFQYDVATDTWSSIPDLPSNHGNNGSCAVSEDGWLYVGTGSNQAWYRLELY